MFGKSEREREGEWQAVAGIASEGRGKGRQSYEPLV